MFIDINEVFRNKNTITSYEVIEKDLTIKLNYGDGSNNSKVFANIEELNTFVSQIVDNYPIEVDGASYNKEYLTAYELFDLQSIYRIRLSFGSSKLIIDFDTEEARDELIAKLNAGGGSGGTTDYNALSNKPQINSVSLSGNKTFNDLGVQEKLIAGENITIVGNTINSTGGGSGGTSNYNELTNRPLLNDVVIEGSKTAADYGIVIPDTSSFATKTELNNKLDASVIWEGSQASYDALDEATKNSIIAFITGA